MNRRADLERNIISSYDLILAYERIVTDSSDPRELARSRRAIEDQWQVLSEFLGEYELLCKANGQELPQHFAALRHRANNKDTKVGNTQESRLPPEPPPEPISSGPSPISKDASDTPPYSTRQSETAGESPEMLVTPNTLWAYVLAFVLPLPIILVVVSVVSQFLTRTGELDRVLSFSIISYFILVVAMLVTLHRLKPEHTKALLGSVLNLFAPGQPKETSQILSIFISLQFPTQPLIEILH
jgi:hypothetical protein